MRLSYLSLSEFRLYRLRAGRLAGEGVSAESISVDVQCGGGRSEGSQAAGDPGREEVATWGRWRRKERSGEVGV